jgi:hypothetical protein
MNYKFTHREEFIQKLFKKNTHIKYSVVKHIDYSINDINKYSDIDIAICKKYLNEILNFILEDNNILKKKINKKSFMCVLELYFKDNSFLSIDLIYAFRRKNIDYIDINELLESSITNHESIKLPSNEYSFLYIFLFYHLNGENIEPKYSDFFNSLEPLEKDKIVNFLNKRFSTKYKNLSEFFNVNQNLNQKIENYIDQNNNFEKKVKNSILYVLDIFANFKKSQVINIKNNANINKKEIIDLLGKKYRKEIVNIDSSKLSFIKLFKLKIKNYLKGHTIIDFNKKINNKKYIIELKSDNSLFDFEKKYIDII